MALRLLADCCRPQTLASFTQTGKKRVQFNILPQFSCVAAFPRVQDPASNLLLKFGGTYKIPTVGSSAGVLLNIHSVGQHSDYLICISWLWCDFGFSLIELPQANKYQQGSYILQTALRSRFQRLASSVDLEPTIISDNPSRETGVGNQTSDRHAARF